jgi:hypothetical protein
MDLLIGVLEPSRLQVLVLLLYRSQQTQRPSRYWANSIQLVLKP